LKEVIQFLGGATIFIAAVAWLIRSIITHLLSKDIEVFKQTLRAEAEKDIALLKSSLELENEKVRIKLTTLEDRRIKVLEDLYIKLTEFSVVASNFTYDPEMEDKEGLKNSADKFIDEYHDFYNYFQRVAIFLPKDLEDSINRLHNIHFNVAIEIGNARDQEFEEIIQKINKNIPNIRSQARDIIGSIAKEFRELLGVES
jgi:hypothetical protein